MRPITSGLIVALVSSRLTVSLDADAQQGGSKGPSGRVLMDWPPWITLALRRDVPEGLERTWLDRSRSRGRTFIKKRRQVTYINLVSPLSHSH